MLLTIPSAISAPCLSSLILPCGNFGEDYDISTGSSMEKWQAGANLWEFAEWMQQNRAVIPAEAGIHAEVAKEAQHGFPLSRE
jgi:hypothetical protein